MSYTDSDAAAAAAGGDRDGLQFQSQSASRWPLGYSRALSLSPSQAADAVGGNSRDGFVTVDSTCFQSPSHCGGIVIGASSLNNSIHDNNNNITEDSGSASVSVYDDVDKLMYARARAGYSMDAAKNLQILSDELDLISSELHDCSSSLPASGLKVARRSLLSLYRTWLWIDRAEVDVNVDDTSLLFTGVKSMVEISGFTGTSKGGSSESETVLRHQELGLRCYVSTRRDVARRMVGWASPTSQFVPQAPTPPLASGAPKKGSAVAVKVPATNDDMHSSSLDALLEEVDDCDSFERASALALWHGSATTAVELLKRNATLLTALPHSHGSVLATEDVHRPPLHVAAEASIAVEKDALMLYADRSGWDEAVIDPSYLQATSLVAMCLAGYANVANAANTANDSHVASRRSSLQLWTSMCEFTITQLTGCRRQSAAYLVCMCKFLLVTLSRSSSPSSQPPDYSFLLNNSSIALEDRLGFALMYLSGEDLSKWLSSVVSDSIASGLLEALMITGLSSEGLSIVQRFVDLTSDVQTCALVTARIIKQRVVGNEASQPAIWLHEYRSWLNKGQLFTVRAVLDVELGRRQRALGLSTSGKSTASSKFGSPAGGIAPSRGVSGSKGAGASAAGVADKKTKSPREWYPMPLHCGESHLLLRCHYCGTSLPLDMARQQQQAAHSRKLKPIVNSCPNCKRQLPRCYVCQLYMGLVNPNLEFNRVLTQRRNQSEESPTHVSSSHSDFNHNVLAMGRWFFFCQRCKHGGHATCLDTWFTNHAALPGIEGNRNVSRDVCGVNGCNCPCSLLN